MYQIKTDSRSVHQQQEEDNHLRTCYRF